MNMPHAGRLSLSSPQTQGLQTDPWFIRLPCHIFLWQLRDVAKRSRPSCASRSFEMWALSYFFMVGICLLAALKYGIQSTSAILQQERPSFRKPGRFWHVHKGFNSRKIPVVTGFCGRRFRVTTEKLCTSDGFILGCFFSPLQLLTELLCVLWSFSAWQWRTCLGLRARNIVSIPNFRAPRIWLNGSGFGRTSTGKHPVASIEMSDFTFVVI